MEIRASPFSRATEPDPLTFFSTVGLPAYRTDPLPLMFACNFSAASTVAFPLPEIVTRTVVALRFEASKEPEPAMPRVNSPARPSRTALPAPEMSASSLSVSTPVARIVPAPENPTPVSFFTVT